MAKQHFYARVPARLSMFNRTDGFDTFAHSEGLEKAFIQTELSAVYENKLNKNDTEAIRTDRMPPVYSQHCLRTGDVVHACIRYQSRDYTGERSAYLCHSLILSQQERQELFASSDKGFFNVEMFEAQTLPDLTAPDAGYPEQPYVPAPVEDLSALAKRYDPDTVKAFLFAVLSSLCAKGKPVFFKMDCADAEASARSTAFLSSILSVIPYHLRQTLSFVSFVTEPGQYPGAKVKCLAADTPEVPASKGLFFDLHTNLVTGLPSRQNQEKVPTEFFFYLLEHDHVRKAYLDFMDRAVTTIPALARTTLKNLWDLVFLFCGSCGLFPQEIILPGDDEIGEFIGIYEKYREAMTVEYRNNAYGFLERYPRRHEAIPKAIFTKLARLYPTEVPASRQLAMDAVLKLIHTDIMRDKLFAFIKNNYDSEDAPTRQAISMDLCRVFYGGFLQKQILTFFGEHFSAEPEQTRDAIFEKMMLTVRTPAVQPQILEFVQEHFAELTPPQRQRLYDTVFEMLPEGDALASQLALLLNGCMDLAPQPEQACIAQRLTEMLEQDVASEETKLLPFFCVAPGFCFGVVTNQVFGPWQETPGREAYLLLLEKLPVVEKTRMVLFAAQSLPLETAQESLLPLLGRLYQTDPESGNFYCYLEAEELTALYKDPVTQHLRKKILQPAIIQTQFDVFDTKLRRDGVDVILQYAQKNTYLVSTAQYEAVLLILRLATAAERSKGKTVFRCLAGLPEDPTVRKNIAGYIRTCLLRESTQEFWEVALYRMSISVLTCSVFLPEDLYSFCREGFVSKQTGKKGSKIVKESAGRAAELILNHLNAACKEDPQFTLWIHRDQEGMDTFLRAFMADYGSGAGKWILAHAEQVCEDLAQILTESMDRIKPPSGNIFAKFFGKK